MIEGALIINAQVGTKHPGNRVSHHQDGTVIAVMRVITNDADVVGIDVIHHVTGQCHHVERRKREEIGLGILDVTVSNQTSLMAQRA